MVTMKTLNAQELLKEDREIDGPDPALSRKGRRAVEIMIGEVGNEKKGRRAHGSTHANGMTRPSPLTDKNHP